MNIFQKRYNSKVHKIKLQNLNNDFHQFLIVSCPFELDFVLKSYDYPMILELFPILPHVFLAWENGNSLNSLLTNQGKDFAHSIEDIRSTIMIFYR